MSRFLIDGLTARPDRCVLEHRRIKLPCGILGSLCKLLGMLSPNCKSAEKLFDSDYVQQLRRIMPDDHVLLFDIQNLKELLLLRRLINTRHISIYLWNPVCSFNRNPWSRWEYPRQLRAAGFTIYTFDRDDAKRYGFRPTNQIYRPVPDVLSSNEVKCDTDLFFVGQDKGRLEELCAIRRMADESGLVSRFFVVPDRHTAPDASPQMLYPQTMPYDETLRWIGRSRCLVEVLQAGQSGDTLRALEALFCRRKLVTNNINADKSPFYSPSRVFIVGRDRPERLKEFVETPFDDGYLDALCRSTYNIEVLISSPNTPPPIPTHR